MPDEIAPLGAAPPGGEPPSPRQTGLTRLALADAATVLSRSGEASVTEAMIREDIEAGAPLNSDGTLNLIHYAAWLVRRLQTADHRPQA